MDDLVNRLRGYYKVGPDGVYGTRSFCDFIPAISLEAATEIESLQEEASRLSRLASQRGARMQIMREWVFTDKPENLERMEEWFDADGVPFSE